jgi:hypothetical protein
VFQIFNEKPKKGEETEAAEPVDTRTGYYPEDIANTFGVPLEQYRTGKTQFTQGITKYLVSPGKNLKGFGEIISHLLAHARVLCALAGKYQS